MYCSSSNSFYIDSSIRQLIASIRTYAQSAVPIGELFSVPVDSSQSFVEDLLSLSHCNPPGITVLIHFNYATPVAVD